MVEKYYLRLMVADKPGVFAKIASILGEYKISISAVLQKDPHSDTVDTVPVVITTHSAKEGNILQAINEIDKLDAIKQKSVCISIVDEHEEKI